MRRNVAFDCILILLLGLLCFGATPSRGEETAALVLRHRKILGLSWVGGMG